ncbi:MAG: choice-of-anchor W domain-containing protein [Planctomycetota bacterium]|nr:choice-of-anchor W domain-containing protein [Planctomycetota bacterium]
MIASIEMAFCCAALASWGPGPGGDSLPLEVLSEAEAEQRMSQSIFAAESILLPENSLISIGPSGGPPVATALNDWAAGTTYGWMLAWDPSLQELSFEVRESASDIELVTWTMPLETFNGLLFSAEVTEVSVAVNNWVLDGVPMDTDLLADITSNRMDLMLSDADLNTTWRLKGDITFDWDGSFPATGMGRFGIYGLPVPAPSAALIILIPLIAGKRRRHRL